MLRFPFDGRLIQEEGVTSFKNNLDRSGNGGLIGKFIWFEPEFGGSLPVTGELGEEVMGRGFFVSHGK